MSKAHRTIKYKLVKEHRLNQYEFAIGQLIEGKVNPEYPNKRFKKLKEVK